MLQAMGLGAWVLNDMDPFSEVSDLVLRPRCADVFCIEKSFGLSAELFCSVILIVKYPERTVFQLSSPKSSGNLCRAGIGFRGCNNLRRIQISNGTCRRDTLFFESKRLALWECFDVNCCRFLDGLEFGKLADNVLLIILMKFFRTRNAQKFSATRHPVHHRRSGPQCTDVAPHAQRGAPA